MARPAGLEPALTPITVLWCRRPFRYGRINHWRKVCDSNTYSLFQDRRISSPVQYHYANFPCSGFLTWTWTSDKESIYKLWWLRICGSNALNQGLTVPPMYQTRVLRNKTFILIKNIIELILLVYSIIIELIESHRLYSLPRPWHWSITNIINYYGGIRLINDINLFTDNSVNMNRGDIHTIFFKYGLFL